MKDNCKYDEIFTNKNKCCQDHGKLLGYVLIPETPFENHMSISTHQEKRAENAKRLLSNFKENVQNGTIVVINKTTSFTANKETADIAISNNLPELTKAVKKERTRGLFMLAFYMGLFLIFIAMCVLTIKYL